MKNNVNFGKPRCAAMGLRLERMLKVALGVSVVQVDCL